MEGNENQIFSNEKINLMKDIRMTLTYIRNPINLILIILMLILHFYFIEKITFEYDRFDVGELVTKY